MKYLIVTADDFGLADEVNRAVEIGHVEGVLTAASLMVGAPAAAGAVETARRLPRLAVGLHLALVDAPPVLPASAAPDLVDAHGRLPTDMARVVARDILPAPSPQADAGGDPRPVRGLPRDRA